jgi:GntR family transcriptional regulator, transcriptional repressor for pyruvate dehydrogenase complex
VSLGPVATVPAYELVLEQLRRSIYLGHFGPGDRLPSERELAQQLGVSRTTVREAVRVLEGAGLVDVRRGSTGGIVVRPPSVRSSELRQRLREFEDLLDFRLAVETMSARLAARRRTGRDIAALQRTFTRLEAIATAPEAEVSEWMRTDSEYHMLIARAARNERIAQAVEEARAGMFMPIGAVWGRIETRAHSMHAELHAAICNGEPERAAAAMEAHVEETRADIHAVVRSTGHHAR